MYKKKKFDLKNELDEIKRKSYVERGKLIEERNKLKDEIKKLKSFQKKKIFFFLLIY